MSWQSARQRAHATLEAFSPVAYSHSEPLCLWILGRFAAVSCRTNSSACLVISRFPNNHYFNKQPYLLNCPERVVVPDAPFLLKAREVAESSRLAGDGKTLFPGQRRKSARDVSVIPLSFLLSCPNRALRWGVWCHKEGIPLNYAARSPLVMWFLVSFFFFFMFSCSQIIRWMAVL